MSVQCKHCGKVFQSVEEHEPAQAEAASPPSPGRSGSEAPLPVVEVLAAVDQGGAALRLQEAGREVEQLQARVLGLQEELDAAQDRLRDESNERAETLERQAAEIARLGDELRSDREALREGRAEVGRLRAELEEAVRGRSLQAEQVAAAADRERNQAAADRARTEGQVVGLMGELDEARRALDEARRGLDEAVRRGDELNSRAERDGRELEAARGRADGADRLAYDLRVALEGRSRELGDRLEQRTVELDAARARCDQLGDELRARDAEVDRLGRLPGELQAERAARARREEDVDRLRGELDEARRDRLELTRRGDALAARGDDADRLALELRDALDQRVAEHDERVARLSGEVETGRLGRLGLEGELAAARSERDDRAAENARQRERLAELGRDLEAATAGRREALHRGEADRARLAGEAATLRSELDAARRRGDAADRLAVERGDEIARLGRDRRAERDEHERAVAALRRDYDDARAAAAAGRETTDALGEAMADLEQRLASTLDDLNAAAERAAWAEAEVKALRRRDERRSEDAPETDAEELARQLRTARESNQRLCSLLGVFGMTKEAASGTNGRVETSEGGGGGGAPAPAAWS